MKRYPKYKDSGVEWIAKIPEHWSAKPLCRVVSCNDDALADDTRVDTNLRYVDISSVDHTAGIKQVTDVRFGDAPSRARRKAKVGDVVISTVRTYLKAVAPVTPEHADCTYSTGFAVLRPRPHQVEPGFLKWMMLNELLVQTVEAHSEGLSYPAINATELVKLKALIPPSAEQRAITAALNRETARIDALISKKARFIELLKEKGRAIITHVVTKGLDPKVKMKSSRVEWIGSVPNHWRVGNIKMLLSEVEYGLSETASDFGNIEFLTMGNVQDGEIIRTRQKFLSNVPKHMLLREGDILFNRTNSLDLVGKVGIFRERGSDPVTFASYLVRLRCKGQINPEYLTYYLGCDPFLAVARTMAFPSVSQANLNPNRYGFLPAPIPPKEEQDAIVDTIAASEKRLKHLVSKTQTSIDLLKERRSALITAAVTGQIDLREEVA